MRTCNATLQLPAWTGLAPIPTLPVASNELGQHMSVIWNRTLDKSDQHLMQMGRGTTKKSQNAFPGSGKVRRTTTKSKNTDPCSWSVNSPTTCLCLAFGSDHIKHCHVLRVPGFLTLCTCLLAGPTAAGSESLVNPAHAKRLSGQCKANDQGHCCKSFDALSPLQRTLLLLKNVNENRACQDGSDEWLGKVVASGLCSNQCTI